MKRKILIFAVLCCMFAASSASAGEMAEYTVKPGDTLGEIVYSLRMQGVDVAQLPAWNPKLGTQLEIGQIIKYEMPANPAREIQAETDKLRVEAERLRQEIARLQAMQAERPEQPEPVTKQDLERALAGLPVREVVVREPAIPQVPAITGAVIADAVRRGNMPLYVIMAVLMVLFAVVFFVRNWKSKRGEGKSYITLNDPIEIGGKMYSYRMEVRKGMYLSPYKGLLIRDLGDAVKSVKSALKKMSPERIKEEIKAGRLRLEKQFQQAA